MAHPTPRARRPVPATYLVLGLLAAGCGGDPPPPAVPSPEHLDALAPALVERIGAFRARVEAAPDDADAWLHLGMLYEAHRLERPALACYMAASDAAGDAGLPAAQAWHRAARVHAGRGELAEAERAIRRSLELEPGYAPSHELLGSLLFDQGRFAEAREAYRRVSGADRRHLGGRVGLARVALQEGDLEEAIRILEAILARKPEEPNAERLLHTAYLQAGRRRDANALRVRWFSRRSLGPDPWARAFKEYAAPTVLARVEEALAAGKHDEAVGLLEEFLEDRPEDLNALAYLAWGHYLARRVEEAERVLARAKDLDPRNLNVLRTEVRIEEASGALDRAADTLRAILAIEPTDLDALRRLGRIEAAAGRCEPAVEAYGRFLALDRSRAPVWLGLGACQLELGRLEDAEDTFRRALEAFPRSAELTTGLARVLVAGGRADEARALLEGAPALDPAGRLLLQSL